MHCPRCREPFRPIHEGLFEDILVEVCAGCAVLWIQSEALDRLDDNVDVRASRIGWDEAPEVDGLQCPRCTGTYRTTPPFLEPLTLPGWRDIVVHRCNTCRAFLLDPPMLDRIRTAVVAMK